MRIPLAIGLAMIGVALGASCSRSQTGSRAIDGAGASLPYPLYAKWASEFAVVDSSSRINYQPLGSGAGIRQMTDGVIDFGATDEPMSDDQLARAPFALVHVPMTVGAVVVTYNVSGVSALRLLPGVVADVFRGAIRRWDDPRIRETNADVPLPPDPITVVFRADGSGTSAAFTTFLAHDNEAWRADVGAGKAPHFPVGVGARGNDGVAAYVKSTPGSIGYVELAHARQADLAIALVRNRAGSFVPPTALSLDRAVRSALSSMPSDLRFSIVDSTDPEAYPIAVLSFLVLPRDAKNKAKADALGRFVWWSIHDGQRFAPALHYAPLPPELVARAESAVKSLRADGKPLDLGVE